MRFHPVARHGALGPGEEVFRVYDDGNVVAPFQYRREPCDQEVCAGFGDGSAREQEGNVPAVERTGPLALVYVPANPPVRFRSQWMQQLTVHVAPVARIPPHVRVANRAGTTSGSTGEVVSPSLGQCLVCSGSQCQHHLGRSSSPTSNLSSKQAACQHKSQTVLELPRYGAVDCSDLVSPIPHLGGCRGRCAKDHRCQESMTHEQHTWLVAGGR